MTKLLVAVLVLGVALVLAPPSADANLPIGFSTPVRTVVQVDLGDYAEYATRVHVVRAGDTLATVAKRVLGDASRAKAIAALNPGTGAGALAAGTYLLLPPARPPVSDAGHERPTTTRPGWSLFMTAVRLDPGDNQVPFTPYAAGSELPDNRGGVWLYAVRTDKLAAFRTAAADVPAPEGSNAGVARFWTSVKEVTALQRLLDAKADWVARTSAPLGGRKRGTAGDPVRTIRERHRVTAIRDGVIHLERTDRRLFDGEGEAISAKEVKKKKEKLNLLLVLLAAAGFAGLLLVAVRRMRSVPAPAA